MIELSTTELDPGLRQPAVLVVDDSAAMREGISAILRHIGCHVETANNGNEGYLKAQAISPDLILSDLEMPVATGFDLLSSVRADTALAMVPFIMITGVSDRSSTRRAMELGADDYLTKPFTPEEVMSTVRGRLDKQRSWRQATQALAANYSQGMMGVLPHEFRTPLNAILGFAELMSMVADQGLTPKQAREFSETIQRAGKRLLSHTTRFLTLMEYQSLQRWATTTDTTAIDNAWFHHQAGIALKSQLPGQGLTPRIDAESDTVRCPAILLRSMVEELLSNAVKFAATDSTIAVRGEIGNQYYYIHIENKGPAFPVERMRQIGAFVQFDRDAHEQQGLGIGLAITSHAARLSGSQMDLRNLPGGIVRASLRLPLA